MGHGNYSGPDTFVPAGHSVGIYAEVDTLLAITIGMSVLSEPGGYRSATTFGGADSPVTPVHNYRVGPLTHPEFQRLRSTDSVKNRIVYVGYDQRFDRETQLCTAVGTCGPAVHACDGILGRVHDPDIRLAFCVGDARRAGLSDMTTVFPSVEEYRAPNAELARYAAEAARWFERITADPNRAIPELYQLATDIKEARELAFVLASSVKLDELLILHDARTQRAALSADAFLHYLLGLPEKTRATVVAALRGDPAPPAAVAPATAADRFVAAFATATTQQRRDAWFGLLERERAEAAENRLIKLWSTSILPVVERHRELAASADQPAGWFEAAALRTELTEFGDDEAQQNDAYRASLAACVEFGRTAGLPARLALWQRLDGRPDARRRLRTVVSGMSPADWEAAPPPNARAELAAWVARYRDSLATVSSSSSSSSSDSSEEDSPFPFFWDDVDADNLATARQWGVGDTVLVVQENGLFRLALHTAELAAAFRTARCSTFEVTALPAGRGGTLAYVAGSVDRPALTAYLAGLAAHNSTVITLA
ncbi:hypothetical protein BX266_0570 [Streptomyces sp. TLI_171]|nr:hypothetical protein BX266_0570 [Streptomyces sp. TLI_171]